MVEDRERLRTPVPLVSRPDRLIRKTVTHPNPSSNPESSATDPHEASAAAPKRSTCNGRLPGRDVENWVQAEPEILRQAARHSHRTALVVKVNGGRYVGEYPVDSADGYTPGEFTAGDPITLRFDGDKMFGSTTVARNWELRSSTESSDDRRPSTIA